MNIADWSQLGVATALIVGIIYLGGKAIDKWSSNKSTTEDLKTVVNNNTQALNQMNTFMQLEMTKQTEQIKQILNDTDKIETVRIKVGEILDYVKTRKEG